MRLVRVATGTGPAYGELDGERIHLLEGSFATGFQRTGLDTLYDEAALLAPVEPSKVVCVARNYALHAAEMGGVLPDEPRIFIKPSTSVIGPNAPILIPPRTERVDPEGELGVVIGKRLFCATPAEALAAIFGFTCVNDVTARDFQKKDTIFGRAKGFDTFCPIGPWVVTGVDVRDVGLRTLVNGEVRANGRTSEMHFDVIAQLVFISSIMTLLPGDVVATGTPPGVAPIADGDVVSVVIEGVGRLDNPVRNREDRR